VKCPLSDHGHPVHVIFKWWQDAESVDGTRVIASNHRPRVSRNRRHNKAGGAPHSVTKTRGEPNTEDRTSSNRHTRTQIYRVRASRAGHNKTNLCGFLDPNLFELTPQLCHSRIARPPALRRTGIVDHLGKRTDGSQTGRANKSTFESHLARFGLACARCQGNTIDDHMLYEPEQAYSWTLGSNQHPIRRSIRGPLDRKGLCAEPFLDADV